DLRPGAGVHVKPIPKSEAILDVYSFLVAAERKDARGEIGNERVLYLFARPGGAESECVAVRHADGSAGVSDPADVLIEAAPELRLVEVIGQIKRSEQFLADTSGDIGLVVKPVIGGVIPIAAYQIEARKIPHRIRPVRAGNPVLAGNERAAEAQV